MSSIEVPLLAQAEEKEWPFKDVCLMVSNPTEFCFRWVIQNFGTWLPDENFIIKSAVFSFVKDSKWRMKLYCHSGIEPQLVLMSDVSRSLNVCFDVSIVNSKFHIVHQKIRTKNFSNSCKQNDIADFCERSEILAKGNDFMVDNDLVLFCKIKIFDFASEVCHENCFAALDLVSNMQSLQKDEFCSDFPVTAGGREFPCHKAVLSCRSKFFEALLTHDMEEKRGNKLVLEDIDAKIFENLLCYIYTSQVDIPELNVLPLLAAADRFCLERLQLMCESKMSSVLSVENAFDVYKLAVSCNMPFLQQRAEQIITGFNLKADSGGDNGSIYNLIPETQKNLSVGETYSLVSSVVSSTPSTSGSESVSTPAVDCWCFTKSSILSKSKWMIKGFKSCCSGTNVFIDSADICSDDKITNVQGVWKIQAFISEQRAGHPSSKTLALSLTCTDCSIDIQKQNEIEYRFSILGGDFKEKLICNGSHKFSLNTPQSVWHSNIKTGDILSSGMLQKDDLVICCILSSQNSDLFDPVPPIPVPKCDLSANLNSLLDSGFGADVVIKTKGSNFTCHKAILAARSPYFKAKIKASSGDEILIDDVEPVVVKELISYIYNNDCKLREKILNLEY